MKKIILSIVLAFTLLLGACSQKQLEYTADVAYVNYEYNIVAERFDIVRQMAASRWDVFSETEQNDLKAIDVNIAMIKSKADKLRSQEFYEVQPSDIAFMYTLAVDSYDMSKAIAIAHRDKLTTIEMTQLEEFDLRVQNLDIKIQEILRSPDNASMNKAFVSTLSLAAMSLKLIIPMLL